MSFDAGTLEAKLDVDRDPFQVGLDQAKADAEEFASKSYSVTLDVNDNGLAKMDQFIARVNEFDYTKATAVLDVNFADDAIAKLDTAEAMVQGFGSEHVTATADINVNDAGAALRGLEQDVTNTERTLGGLGNTSTSVGTKFRQTKNDVDILAGGLVNVTEGTKNYLSGMSAVDEANTALSKGFADARVASSAVSQGLKILEGDGKAASDVVTQMGGSASGAGGSFGGLGSAISDTTSKMPAVQISLAYLASALIPIAGVAAGAGIGLVGMATSAGAALGAFALAAAGDFGKFTATLKSEVADWQSQLKSVVQPTVDSLTNLIAPALNDITPLVERSTGAIKNAIGSIGNVLNGGGLHNFIDFLAAQAPNAIGSFTLSIENLGHGFASVLEAFAPEISTVELGLVSLTSKFADLGNSSGLKSFVSYVQQEGPVVGKFFEAIIPAAGKLIAAFAPLGDAALRQLTPFVTELGNLAPVLGLVTGAMDLVARATQILLGPLQTLTKWIGEGAAAVGGFLGSVGNFLGFTSSAGDSTTKLAEALQKAGLSAGVANADIADFGVTTIQTMGASAFAAEQLGAKVGLTGQQFIALEKQTNTSGAATVTALQKAASSANITAGAMGELELATGKAGTAIASSINSAGTAAQTSFQSATSAISHFSGQVQVSGADIANFYGEQVLASTAFASNIQAAIKDGYSPALIQQVLAAGQSQAGPFLQGLVDAAGTAYEGQIKAASNALAAIGQEAAEEARLTQRAVLNSSSLMVDNLSSAIAIQQERSIEGAGASVQAIASKLNQGLPQVAAIAGIYGEQIPGAMSAAQGQTYLAAIAQGKSVTDALIAAVGPTKAAAEINAGILGGAVTSQIPGTSAASTNQASQLYLAQIAALGATEVAAYNLAITTGNQVDIQAAVAAAKAYNLATGVAGGLNSGAGAVAGAAGNLAGQAASHLGFDASGIGAQVGNSFASGLSSAIQGGVAVAESAASSVLNSLNSLFHATPGHNATGTGMGTFAGMTWVGEQGPELVNFGEPVQIITNQDSKAMASSVGDRAIGSGSNSAGGTNHHSVYAPVQVTVTVQGNLDNVTLPQVRREISGGLNDVLAEIERDLVAMAPV